MSMLRVQFPVEATCFLLKHFKSLDVNFEQKYEKCQISVLWIDRSGGRGGVAHRNFEWTLSCQWKFHIPFWRGGRSDIGIRNRWKIQLCQNTVPHIRVFLYFLIFCQILAEICQAALTFNGCEPFRLYVNTGRILPWFGRKLQNIGKLDCCQCYVWNDEDSSKRFDKCQIKKKQKVNSTRMGFEPTRGDPIGLAVQRLNHSATSSRGDIAKINKFIK